MTYCNAATKSNRIILQKNCRQAEECSICLDSLIGKTAAYLPCTHFFHYSCLKMAFEKKLYTCPLCRHDLVAALLKTNYIFPIEQTIYYAQPPALIDDDDDFFYWSTLLLNIIPPSVPIYNEPIYNDENQFITLNEFLYIYSID